MLKSNILKKLGLKHENLSESDIEQIFNIFIKKIVSALKDDKNVELRGFGTLKKKINKAKQVRKQKTNKKLVNVRIFGQEYPIRASSNEEYIKEVASYVDKKMHEVQRSVPSSMNASKIAILAAMNISDELFGARRGEYSFKGEVESKVKSLIERIEEITD